MNIQAEWMTLVTARAALRYWAETTSNPDYKRYCETAYVELCNAMTEAQRREYMPNLFPMSQRQAG